MYELLTIPLTTLYDENNGQPKLSDQKKQLIV